MSKLIKLTQHLSNTFLYLNVDNIVCVHKFEGKTYITCVNNIKGSSDYVVNEPIDKVISMIDKSH